jgi:hypothetical protein
MKVEPDLIAGLAFGGAKIDRVGPRAASTDRIHQSAKPFLMLNVLEAFAPPNASEGTPTVLPKT